MLSPLGPRAMEEITVWLGFVALAACAWVVYRLGGAVVRARRRGARGAAPAHARADPLLRRARLRRRALPALVLAALLVESRRRARPGAGARAARARRPAAPGGVGLLGALLAVPGVRGSGARRFAARPRGSAPDRGSRCSPCRRRSCWVLSDLLVTGNPLWSLTNTRHTADDAGPRDGDRQRARVHTPPHRRDPAPAGARGGRARRRAVAAVAAPARARCGASSACWRCRVRRLRRGRTADQHALRVPRGGDPVRSSAAPGCSAGLLLPAGDPRRRWWMAGSAVVASRSSPTLPRSTAGCTVSSSS